jgi:hypothetical protein
MLIALGYVTGLMLQAVSKRYVQRKILLTTEKDFPSARWLLPEDTHFSRSCEAQINPLITEQFNVSTIIQSRLEVVPWLDSCQRESKWRRKAFRKSQRGVLPQRRQRPVPHRVVQHRLTQEVVCQDKPCNRIWLSTKSCQDKGLRIRRNTRLHSRRSFHR